MKSADKHHTVIVVNDNPSQLRMLSAILEKDELNVISCLSAEEALRIMKMRDPVDAVVTDLYMPGINGWRLCRLLRSPENASFNKIPILVVSATFSGSDAAQVTADLGANAFLSAPYDPAVLRAYVQDLLKGKTPQVSTNVLIMSCDQEEISVLESVFQPHGYRVHGALTGEEGQDLFLKHSPEIVIIDYNLPDISCDHLLKKLDFPGSSTVVIVLTSDHNPDRALQLMKKGVDGYAHRPFDPEYLVILCERARREHSLLRVEQLLEKRTLELVNSAEKYRLLLSSIPEIVIVHDADGIILQVNKVGAYQLEWPADDLIGMNLINIISPQLATEFTEHINQAVKEGTCRFETTYISRTGRLIEADVSECLIEYEKKQAILSVGHDISKRKHMEDKLRKSEQQSRHLVETTSDWVWEVDEDFVFTYVNPQIHNILGYEPGEIIGEKIFEFMSPDESESMLENIRIATGNKMFFKDLEVTFIHKDGHPVIVESASVAILDEKGNFRGYRGINRDITERKEMEEKRKKLEIQLRQSQKMEAVGTLAGGIAHNFNNILCAVLGYASLIKMRAEHNDEIIEYVDKIEYSAHRAATLTQQLLGFARGGKYVVKPLECNRIIQSTLSLLKGSMDTNIVVVETCSCGDFGIMGDESQIQQAILNVCLNARDAMPRGGKLQIVVDIKDIKKAYPLKGTEIPPGKYVVMQIVDTGMGMTGKTMDRIFEPFFTSKKTSERTGLGLAMVYGIVKNHGGYIDVHSKPGKGSNFALYFPAVKIEEREIIVDLPKVPATSLNLNVLLVDDEEIMRNLGRDIFLSLGCPVTLAKDGNEAIEIYLEKHDEIDLVILDIIMPQMSGHATLEQLLKINPKVKVLASSGYNLDNKAAGILEAGALGFLQKPFNIHELTQSIQKIMT